MADEEIWKKDADFPDYEFSNLGRVRSFRQKGRVRYLNGTSQRTGHISIELQSDNLGRLQPSLSRMIAKVFLGNCPQGQVVRHLNGNPRDNRISNLAYGTLQQNSIERYQHAGTFTGNRCRPRKDKAKRNSNSACALLGAAIKSAPDDDDLPF